MKMDETNLNRPLRELIDKLVDGELREDDYRNVLQIIDQKPEGWRDCALAFLEAQALQKELGTLLENSEFEEELVSALGAHQDDATNQSFYDSEIPPSKFSGDTDFAQDEYTVERSARTRELIFNVFLPAAAASLVLGLSIGLFFFVGKTGTDGEHAALPSKDPDEKRELDSPELTLVVNQGSKDNEVELPVYSANKLDPSIYKKNGGVSSELVNYLRGKGFELDRQRQVLPMATEKGQQFLLPVEKLNIVPRNQKRFQ